MTKTSPDLCPCGSKTNYDDCCGPFHRKERKAKTCEELMRSRYSAFVKCDVDFIVDTAHSDTHKETKREDIETWSRESTWGGFEIIDIEGGGVDDEQGLVEFIAFYEDADGDEVEHHEKAVFGREDGEWKFIDGLPGRQEPFVREEPKIGRNDPCSCGSGKKFKKCCGKAG